ncbi:hypothetical protein ACE02P_18195 [Shewanella bicestrii]
MIREAIEGFHVHRLAGEHEEATKCVNILVTKYQLTKKYLVTALVREDFRDTDCEIYLREIGLKELLEP